VGLSRRSGLVCLVTDRRRLRPGGSEAEQIEAVVAQARAAAGAGVDLFQLRERGLADGVLLRLAARVVKEAARTDMRVLVNDRPDVALAAGAHGVHLPETGLAPATVRRIAPREFLIGRSVHSAEGASEAGRAGADLAIFGTIFASASKPTGDVTAGCAALAEAVRACGIPVLGIGGITQETVAEVAATGAAGIAAIGWLASCDGVRLREVVSIVRMRFDSPHPLI
jgi:thiamine-phosphate diphosphorylase